MGADLLKDADYLSINGGFFWMQEGPCIYRPDERPIKITNCVFMQRPRWYQVCTWARICKYILALPHVGPSS